MAEELKLYVYTKRRAKLEKGPQFVDLIPKLIGYLYQIDEEIHINDFIKKQKEELGDKYNNIIEILNYYLDKSNYINDIENASDDDKTKIKNMNREIIQKIFLEPVSDIQKNMFIEHLFRGHANMQYGIYFSMKYAKDDEDFKNKLGNISKSPRIGDRIIIYTTIDKLVDHCLDIKRNRNIRLPILYLNPDWQYGKIKCDTIILDDNKDIFINKIKTKYPPTSRYKLTELICQIPLEIAPELKEGQSSNVLFNFFYVNDQLPQSGGYREKYLKYKNKYLKLKAQIKN
jgi:hypothetical protein